MRGYYHSTLSIIIGMTISFPYLLFGTYKWATILQSAFFILALIWGSLVPDVDASDSRFFYKNKYASQFFEYFIYYPISYVLNDKKHRGIMHSLEGAIISTALFLLYIIGILGIISIIGIFFLPSILQSVISSFSTTEHEPIDLLYIIQSLLIVGSGLLMGILLHIYEDSLTIAGINWRYTGSNKWYQKGNIRVGGINEELIFTVLLGATGIIFIMQYEFRSNILIGTLLGVFTVITILLIGQISRTNLFVNIFGEDVLEKDQNTRNRAKENVQKLEINNSLVLTVEKGRIQRGLAINPKDIDLEHNKVNDYIIEEKKDGDNVIFSCSCKDFKNTGDITICKHIVAYLVNKHPTYKTKFKKMIN